MMKFPRLAAAIVVLLLIGGLSLIAIEAVALIGPALAHGENTTHVAGTIVQVEPDHSFIFKSAGGQELHFICTERCLREVAHMQRHVREKAHTDVYYIQMPDHMLAAVDVD
jgi:hypothetical protein